MNKAVMWVWVSLAILIWLKSTTVGSEFDFIQWWRYGKAYTRWYFNREDWLFYRVKHSIPTRKEKRAMSKEEEKHDSK